MNEYLVSLTVRINNENFSYQSLVQSISMLGASAVAIKYMKKTCPMDFEEATQIVMRIKRKLR